MRILYPSVLLAFGAIPRSDASYGRSIPPEHMRTFVDSNALVQRQDTNASTVGLPLTVINLCTGTIHPAVNTQHGTKPSVSGFELKPGESMNLTVSPDWQGRIWGRTNCSFPNSTAPQRACRTGDCAGALDCSIAGEPPVTLAEFTMKGHGDLAFYDISVVDGFNLGVAIEMISNGVPALQNVPARKSNPSCVASVSNFNESFMPYENNQMFLGTTRDNPMPLVTEVTRQQVSRWCPWDLQVSPPKKPGDGVYNYPDDNILRPTFQACFSACAKYNKPKDCCTGAYNSPNVCKGGQYSRNAKTVCPDAYTFAYDDQDSTFTTKTGAAFRVLFCPPGKSTNILKQTSSNTVSAKSNGQSPQTTPSKTANAETSTPPWILLTGAALVVTACIFSTL